MLITNRFNATLLDDLATDPQVDQTVNFTDDSRDNYVTKTVTLTAAGTSDWRNNTPVRLFVEAGGAKYVIVQPTKQIHCYLADPGTLPIAGDPVFSINNLFVLSGNLLELWAVSSVVDGTNNTYVKLIYVY